MRLVENDRERERKKRLIGNDPIRVSPWALCPSPSVVGVLVGVEAEMEPEEEVTVEFLMPSEMTVRLLTSPSA